MTLATAPAAQREKVREVQRNFKYFSPIRLLEVQDAPDDESRTARCIIITEGLGNLRDRNFYTADAVDSAAKVFGGKQFYVDHPSAQDEENRPERSMRDLAGYFFDTEVGSIRDPDTGENLAAAFATLKFANSEPGRLAFEQMKEALDYQRRFPNSKDVYAGISINGGGVSHAGTIRGMEVNMVTEIQEAFSADIVTKPARGGRFVAVMKEEEVSRLAAWKRRAREARPRGGVVMTTATAQDVKVKKGLRETRAGIRALQAAVESKKMKDVRVAMKNLHEVAKRTMRLAEAVEGEEEAKARLVKLATALRKMRMAAENGEGMDPATILADIKDDVDSLGQALGVGGNGGGPAAMPGDEEAEGEDEEDEEAVGIGDRSKPVSGEPEDHPGGPDPEPSTSRKADGQSVHGEDKFDKGTLAEDEEDEEDEEGEGYEDEEDEEDEEAGYGMRGEDDEDEEGAEAGRGMQYSCASCGETNRVMPPKGFKLTAMGESIKSGLSATVRRLRRSLESKEVRFVRHNQQHRRMLQENTQLRAEIMAQKRLELARKALREAKIPPDLARPKHLLPYEPEQWPALIKGYKRMLSKESNLYRGGAGPSGGGYSVRRQDGTVKNAEEKFKEAYAKPHDILS